MFPKSSITFTSPMVSAQTYGDMTGTPEGNKNISVEEEFNSRVTKPGISKINIPAASITRTILGCGLHCSIVGVSYMMDNMNRKRELAWYHATFWVQTMKVVWVTSRLACPSSWWVPPN